MRSILCMHEVVDANLAAGWTLTRRSFNDVVEALREAGFVFVTVEELARNEVTTENSTCRVALTVDDGYESDLWLSRYCYDEGVPLTAFINPGTIGRSGYLSPHNLAQVVENGARIESHGYWHEDLSRLSRSQLHESLDRSRSAIERLAGRAPTAIAYPWGQRNRRVRDAAVELGYHTGFTVRPATVGRTCPPFAIPRFALDSTSTGQSVVSAIVQDQSWSRSDEVIYDLVKKVKGLVRTT